MVSHQSNCVGANPRLEDDMSIAKWSLGIAVAFGVSALWACSDTDETPTPTQSENDAGVDSGSQPANDAATTPDATADAATAASLGSGPFTLVYAGSTVGIDMRPIAAGKATFDGLKLTAYEASDDERPTAGTNEVKDSNGDAFVAIGRWGGGTTGGKFYNAGNAGLIDFPANGGFHYAIGNFADPIPSSGPATYTELSKTAATVSDGSLAPGTITGTLAANLAGADTKVGFSITIDIPGDATYTLTTTGGTANVSTTEAQVLSGGNVKGAFYTNLNITSNGAACVDTCSGGVDGFIAGPNAERIALVAHVYKGSGGAPKSVAGAIVFKK